MNRYFITEFPFEFEDGTPIALAETLRVGVLRKVAHGARGFSVFVEGLLNNERGAGAVLNLDAAMVAMLRRRVDGVVSIHL